MLRLVLAALVLGSAAPPAQDEPSVQICHPVAPAGNASGIVPYPGQEIA